MMKTGLSHLSFPVARYVALLLSAFFIFVSTPSFATYFESLSIEHGISQSSVYSMAQDHHGFLWVGTGDGLNRYDGVEFVHFKSTGEDSKKHSFLSDNMIYGITVDSNGNLWINTKNGLNFLDTTHYKTKHFFHDPQNPNTISNNEMRTSAFDSNGFLWIRTSSGGLDRFDPRTEQFTYFADNPVDPRYHCGIDARKVIVDKKDHIWIGSNNGLCRFDHETKQFEWIDYRKNELESASHTVRDIYLDDNGNLWIASTHGLFEYRPDNGESISYFHNPNDENSLIWNWTAGIVESESGQFWIATSRGLSLLDRKTGKFTNYRASTVGKTGLSRNELYSIFIDKSGLVWIGTNGSGLNMYNPKQQFFKHISNNTGKPGYVLSDPSVWGFNNAYGYIWIATSNGLNRYHMKTGKIKQYLPDPNNQNSLVNNIVYEVMPGNNRDLWISTWAGLSHFFIDEERFVNYKHEVNNPDSLPFHNILSLYYDDERDFVWLTSNGKGVTYLDVKTNKFTLFRHDPNNKSSLSNDYVVTVNKAPDGLMWLTTRDSLDSYDYSTNEFKRLTDESSFASLQSHAVKPSQSGNILLATDDGLAILDPKSYKPLRIYTVKDGLDDDYIYSIEEAKDGLIWMGTNHGLSSINSKNHEIRNYDIYDGLQGFEFNGTSSFNDGEYLYFGGYNGFNYFKPEDITEDDFVPPVVITGISIHGKRLNKEFINESIKLTYKDTFFSIDFSVLDFKNPKKNLYAYKLEGFDKDWVYNGNRNFASYTNLNGGVYTFRVKGANKNGTWNEVGASLVIDVESPPWKRWWAYLTYIVLILLFVYFIIRFKTLADSRALGETLRQMSTSLTNTLELDTIQSQLANHLQSILPYRKITIFLSRENVFQEDFGSSVRNTGYLNLNEDGQNNLLAYMVEFKQPVYLTKSEEFKEFGIQNESKNISSLLALPLITRENIIGAVLLYNPKQQPNFRESNINIAVTLCAQASAAIDNARLFEETKQLAFYDSLTGLENRRLFKKRLELALKAAKRNRSSLAVMFLDLDQFKRVNDSLGHNIGDALLVEAAFRLKSCIRAQDTVARIGGDEFTILLTDVNDIRGVNVIAKKILDVYAKPMKLEGNTITVSASIGISLAPKDSMDADTLMKSADVAMYKAKDLGRNNYQFFTEEMNTQVSRHLIIENDLRESLSGNDFELVYQPLIDLKSNLVMGVEALIRWNHRKHGMMLPEHFISVAEDAGLINTLGEWALDEACSQAKYLAEQNLRPIKMAINLSAKQIVHGNLIDIVTRALEKYELGAEFLILEITENILVDNSKETIKALFELKKLGATLAIDDFGTGYSSLSYLKQLPIDVIKVDRSFVQGIPDDVEDIEIAAAIVAMAHKLKLKVIAEGVETKAQLQFLRQNNCDIAQGFYYYQPMQAQELLSILKNPQIKSA